VKDGGCHEYPGGPKKEGKLESHSAEGSLPEKKRSPYQGLKSREKLITAPETSASNDKCRAVSLQKRKDKAKGSTS